MPSERINFNGAQGQRLAARLDTPDGAPAAHALFAHCFTCSKDVLAASRIAQGLAAHGIAVLRFDLTGLGSSEGDFANTNFSSNVADLIAAADHLRSRGTPARLLVGHSLGGAAVLAAAAHIDEVRAVATIAAPSDPSHVAGLFAEALPQIEADGEAMVRLSGRPFRITRQFLEDAGQQRLAASIRTLGALDKALLVLHAPADDTVDIRNATDIFGMARHPKSFVSLGYADHLLTRRHDARYAADIIAAWSSRYLGNAGSSA